MVIQLNDEYTGGELEIKDNDNNEITLEKGLGNLFLFYSYIIHRVKPVTSGTRYSLVNWFRLTPIENFKKTLI
jgi:PKHD-type hydroxylase